MWDSLNQTIASFAAVLPVHPFFVLIFGPLFGAACIGLTGRLPLLRNGITLLTALLTLVGTASILLLSNVFTGVVHSQFEDVVLVDMLPGLGLAFSVEPLGALFASLASVLWVVNTVYGLGYMQANKESNQTLFFACFPIAVTGLLGMAFADNLLTLFVFYEVLTFSTYPLVTHKRSSAALKAGHTYMGVLVAASICLLMVAIIWTYSLVGHVDFQLSGIFNAQQITSTAGENQTSITPYSSWLLGILLALFVFGTAKAAIMPMHRWLPAAMVAPTPVSAFLHAVAVVKGGVFTVIKVIVYIFGVDTLSMTEAAVWLPYAAAFTIIAASIVALRADNLKRRLAYSTISQLAYIVIAMAVLAPFSVVAAGLHLLAHAVSKITLFYAAGNIYTAAHKTNISQLDGIGRRMPVTMLAFFIGAASLIGLPFTIGLISKELIMQAAISVDLWPVLGVLILSSLLNAAYFMPIVHRAFFRFPERQYQHGEAPKSMVCAILFTSTVVVALSFVYEPIQMWLNQLSTEHMSGHHSSLLKWIVWWEIAVLIGTGLIWWFGKKLAYHWGMWFLLLQLLLANTLLVLVLAMPEMANEHSVVEAGHAHHTSNHWLAKSSVWWAVAGQFVLMLGLMMTAALTDRMQWFAKLPLLLAPVVRTLVVWNQQWRNWAIRLITGTYNRIKTMHTPDGYFGHTVASGGMVMAVLFVFVLYLGLYLFV